MNKLSKLKHSTTEKDQQNEELFSKKDIENSPFTLIHDNEQKHCFAVMGDARLTEFFPWIESKVKAEHKCINEVSKITWNRIIQVTLVLLDKTRQMEELIKEQIKTEE